jgi:flagellar biosynthetic protein FliO
MNMMDALRGLAALAVVVALLMVLPWFFRKVMGRKVFGGSVAKIVGGVSLGTRERLLVVEVGGRWIVVGVAPGRVNALANIDPSPALLEVVETVPPRSGERTSSPEEASPSVKFPDLFARLREK